MGKNGRTLFDRPKPTVGCSSNGRKGGGGGGSGCGGFLHHSTPTYCILEPI